MANAKTGFKGVNDPTDVMEDAKAKEELEKKGPKNGVFSEEDRPVRNDNSSVGGATHLKERR